MKYIIIPTELRKNKFIYKIKNTNKTFGTEVSQTSNFFHTKDDAIKEAKRQLIKNGVNEDNIVVQ